MDLEQGGLAHAVGADHAHDAVAGQLEGKVVDQHAAVELLVQMLGNEHLLPRRGPTGIWMSAKSSFFAAPASATIARSAPDAPCSSPDGPSASSRTHSSSRLHALGELGLALTLGGHTGGLGLQVGGVVALVREQLPAVDLADPLGHVVEKVAIVRDGEHRAGVVLEELLQPQHRLGIQVVRRLVEQQQVGRLEQQAAQRHAATLAAGKHVHGHVGIRALQRVHRLGELAVQVPAVRRVDLVLQLAHLVHERVEIGVGLGHLLADLVEALNLGDDVGEGHLHVLEDGLVLVERRLLLKDAHRVAGGQACVARQTPPRVRP